MLIPIGNTSISLTLDRTSPIPLYHQLVQQVITAIESGRLRPGDVLEREDALAERLGIARPTLRHALAQLVEKGLITRSRQLGTVVADPPGGQSPARPAAVNKAASPEAARLLRFESDHLDPSVAAEMGLQASDPMVYLEHLHPAGATTSLRRQWLPARLVDPTLYDLGSVPTHRVLSDLGHAAATERRAFLTRVAALSERFALKLAPGASVHTVCTITFDGQGQPIRRSEVICAEDLTGHRGLLATG